MVKRAKNFADLIKNTYRVLLSRGMKGCYVYFQDKDTERFFRSRMETAPVAMVAEEEGITALKGTGPPDPAGAGWVPKRSPARSDSGGSPLPTHRQSR